MPMYLKIFFIVATCSYSVQLFSGPHLTGLHGIAMELMILRQ